MSKGFQECWGTVSIFHFNEVAKAGLNGKVTFKEGYEEGEGLSYINIEGTAF